MTVQGPVAIIGAGRMGRGLSLALQEAGIEAALLGRTRRPQDTLSTTLVLIAVPDESIGMVAEDLARGRTVGERHVVLHLSGLLDRGALDPLGDTGAALGSFHPLQSIADPSTARARLRGACAGLEGDDRALDAGERLARALGMHPVRLAPGVKPAYHAGAVIASNYVVVLASLAEGLAQKAGIPPAEARGLPAPARRGVGARWPHHRGGPAR